MRNLLLGLAFAVAGVYQLMRRRDPVSGWPRALGAVLVVVGALMLAATALQAVVG